MLRVENISVRCGVATTLQDVSFSLGSGRALAVVGESGAGKSTLIGAILGLVPCASGQISWHGAPVCQCHPALVMQEPRAAFNPRLSLRRSVMEPVVAQKMQPDLNRLDQLCQGLELDTGLLDRHPSEVSIGQAQRVGILRALIAAPPLVLFDEPLSALDAVTQKHTARLIAQMQMQEGFAALIVTHDLGYAAAFADDIAVLRAGQVAEYGAAHAFVAAPQTAYGRKLRDAAFALGALEHVA
ncbi:peptide/nickel transport system ATP-binding protein [Yoonia maricola]|uniref:Peptide/nickel transport system ATP-binding protein n=1 Tax=Yoonia maricola TaxID=420999 RepID=A0A2M8W165_9RHOB|nr:ATP-binding cassette domain-containing protein [Yoonia maricola]PJI84672.1 peptide/nickel transport system ATP-binding protein [Yoonia maricola]